MSRLKSRLLHYPMRTSLFVTERTALLAVTQGRVLEIGFEPNKNVAYYSPWVTDLAIVSLDGASSAPRQDSNDRGLLVERIFPGADSVKLPFANSSFDWVVTTLTLCRTKNTGAILAEVRRVLKPLGGYVFLEHGRSPNPSVGRWQQRLRNLWLKYGGCDLDSEIDRMILGAGFRIETLDRYEFGRPKFLSTMYRGLARRS
jgi:SAM-dependent methyltransferase